MGTLAVGLAYLVLYAAGAWALAGLPFARSIFGNVGLLVPPIAGCVIILRRRREWAGCQRLFWDTLGIGLGLWIIGHLGWTYDELIGGSAGWLRWHSLFSLCGGIFPLIAVLAQPHRGQRTPSLTSVGLLIAGYGLLMVFVYSYFVLVPSLVLPEPQARRMLLLIVQIHRGALVASFVAVALIARRTPWRFAYALIAAGVATGFFLRLATSRAILQGWYQTGTLYDLAWIIPFLCYAAAAHGAPASEQAGAADAPRQVSPAWLAVPVFLIPLIGYGTLSVSSLGHTADSVRALLTGLLTVGGLGLLTLRLTSQGSELQRIDDRLRLLAAATEQTDDLILITRTDGSVEHANDAFLRAMGYTRQQLAACSFADLLEHGFARVGRHILAEIDKTGVWRGTLLRRRHDGSTFPASCTVVALRAASGITHMVGVERDITDELRLRDQLVQTERLSAIGELVAGVAHEINNPLQTVLGSVELMLEDGPPPAVRKDLETVRREAARAAQIVRSLLSFVRRSNPDRRLVDINDIVRQAVTLREFQIQQKGIELSLDLWPAPLRVLASGEELQQVVLNLLLNAEQAIASVRSRGAIAVRTRDCGARHAIEVSDDGPGISDAVKGRIFEPFFTTKPVGEGTGLGLSISHGIVAAHGGALELADAAVGATFRITLPGAPEPKTGEVPAAPVASMPPASRALVVDDEASVRALVARLLRRRGYEVVEAASGPEALQAVRAVDLVLCDVRMPGMTGPELHRQVVSGLGEPVPRFVFMTGDGGADDGMPLPEGVPILGKPFTAAELDRLLGA